MTAPELNSDRVALEDPDEPTFTNADVAAATGLSEAATRRFWLALGLPDAGSHVGYTHADLRAARTFAEVVSASEIDAATGIRLVRAMGQNVVRMSDWQVAAVASRAEQIESAAVAETSQRIAAEVLDSLEEVLVHSWRRHVGASLTRLHADTSVDSTWSSTVTVGFADLVAFSTLSNELDVNRLGELVEIFEARCSDVVAGHDGRMIKTLGDSVLFLAERPNDALRIAHGIIDVIGHDTRLPDVHVGLASGPIVTRMGDIFGPPVNLASRLTALARRNRVMVDAETARLMGPEWEGRTLTARPVRGFGVLEPVAVRRR